MYLLLLWHGFRIFRIELWKVNHSSRMFCLIGDVYLSHETNVWFHRLIFVFAFNHCTVSLCWAKDREKKRGESGFCHASGHRKSCGAHGPVEFAEGTVRLDRICCALGRNLNLHCNVFGLRYKNRVMHQWLLIGICYNEYLKTTLIVYVCAHWPNTHFPEAADSLPEMDRILVQLPKAVKDFMAVYGLLPSGQWEYHKVGTKHATTLLHGALHIVPTSSVIKMWHSSKQYFLQGSYGVRG